MPNESDYIVDGFVFSNVKEFEKAKKELEVINKIKSGIDISDETAVRKTYKTLVEKKYFVTPVGISFLHEMQSYLIENIGDVNVKPIEIKTNNNSRINALNPEKYKKLKEQYISQNKILKRLVLAVVSFAIILIGMIIIVATNDNVGYINTEEKIVNKYSSWEESLKERELNIRNREEELGIKIQNN